jgi:hypothetical protein
MVEHKASISDELLQLSELKEKGALSEEEFTSAKAAVLRTFLTGSPCEQCAGSGHCIVCKGGGKCPNPFALGFISSDCAACSGTGRCGSCLGRGFVVAKE